MNDGRGAEDSMVRSRWKNRHRANPVRGEPLWTHSRRQRTVNSWCSFERLQTKTHRTKGVLEHLDVLKLTILSSKMPNAVRWLKLVEDTGIRK